MERTLLGTIEDRHVGKWRIKNPEGIVIDIGEAIGPVQRQDIGKRFYMVDGVIQVENNEQRDTRLAGPVRGLYCTCCGQRHRGRQHWNMDTGHGLGPCCIELVRDSIKRTEADDDEEVAAIMRRRYGQRGINYDIQEKRQIRVTFIDGNVIATSINGTEEEICSYYIGQSFNFGDTDAHPGDLMVEAVKVEFLD